MPKVILIAHNLRSSHNVGSLLRTADGLGVSEVYLTGYTPYPVTVPDDRLPHLANKLHHQIEKTALGAENSVDWYHEADALLLINRLRDDGYRICALEQTANSQNLKNYHAADKLVLIIGREVEGVEPEVLAVCDDVVEITMKGQKESLNVVQAAAIALYQLI